MKKLLFLPVFLLLSFILTAQSTEELDAVIDFTITMESLYTADKDQQQIYLSLDKFLILEGSIAEIKVIEGDDPQIILDLVGGDWQDNGRIEIYKCKVILKGSQWLKYIPISKKEIKKDSLLFHGHVLVVGSLVEFNHKKEENIPVILGHSIRIIP